MPVADMWMSGETSVGDISLPPVGARSDLERSRSRLASGVAKAKGGSAPLRGLSPTYTLRQREQLIKRLQDELVLESVRTASVAQAWRAANEHLEQLAREDAA
eukprot:730182-Alexandrium_andersonii.AAC.1